MHNDSFAVKEMRGLILMILYLTRRNGKFIFSTAMINNGLTL